jgi:hypothetical protein
MPAIEKAKTDALRLVAKAVTRANWLTPLTDESIAAGRQGEIEQFAEHAALRFDELAVHAGISTCRR